MENVRQLLLLYIHSNMSNGKMRDLAHLRPMPWREIPGSSKFSRVAIKTVWKLKDSIIGAVNHSIDPHNIPWHQDDFLKGGNYVFCRDVRQDKDDPLGNSQHGVFLTHNSKYLLPSPVDSLFMQEENRSMARIFTSNIKKKKPGSGQHTGKIAENLFIMERLSL